jgi:hypothetical protein
MPTKLSADSKSVRVHVMFTEEMLDEIEDWRRQRPRPIPSFADSIRQLVAAGLAARRKRRTKK